MSTLAACPASIELQCLAKGTLPVGDLERVAQHVDGCPSCQAALEQLGGAEDIAVHLAHAPGKMEPALAEAMVALQSDKGSRQTSAQDRTNDQLATGQSRLEFLDPPQTPGHLGRLAHYEILEVVGRGGMGIVLKAHDTKLQRVTAIKVMLPELAVHASARQRFIREARAAAAVCHDHVVTIHAVAEDHSPPYLVMQYVPGRSLQERIDDWGPLELNEILRIGMQTASGLAAAHAQGLVHRDIKPANILLENGVERVKITDFGLARVADDSRLTRSGVVTGTPQYMSPEQAGGKAVDHRADLFSLGGVLYAMCTGYAPFRASSSMAVLKKVCDESPRRIGDLNAEIPPWLAAIAEKLMAKNAQDRFQSAAEVAILLGQHLAHLQQPAVFPQPAEVAPAARPRQPRIPALVALIVLFGLLPAVCFVSLGGLAIVLIRLSIERAEARFPPAMSHPMTQPRIVDPPAVEPRAVAPSPGPPPPVPRPTELPVLPANDIFPALRSPVPRPTETTRPAETVLMRFTPDKTPITTQVLFTIVKPDKDGWCVTNGATHHIPEDSGPRARLFEVARPDVVGKRVVVRCKIQSDGVEWARLYLRDQDDASVITTKGRNVEGSTNWTDYEFYYDFPEGASPKRLAVDVGLSAGTVWLKDLELVTTPREEK